uniref:Uncharacterized protein n=1 Tax=Arundo donax TaxID=35708 RepID=A0A0A9F814_ARUDO
MYHIMNAQLHRLISPLPPAATPIPSHILTSWIRRRKRGTPKTSYRRMKWTKKEAIKRSISRKLKS